MLQIAPRQNQPSLNCIAQVVRDIDPTNQFAKRCKDICVALGVDFKQNRYSEIADSTLDYELADLKKIADTIQLPVSVLIEQPDVYSISVESQIRDKVLQVARITNSIRNYARLSTESLEINKQNLNCILSELTASFPWQVLTQPGRQGFFHRIKELRELMFGDDINEISSRYSEYLISTDQIEKDETSPNIKISRILAWQNVFKLPLDVILAPEAEYYEYRPEQLADLQIKIKAAKQVLSAPKIKINALVQSVEEVCQVLELPLDKISSFPVFGSRRGNNDLGKAVLNPIVVKDLI